MARVNVILFGRLALKFGKELTLEIGEDVALADFAKSFFQERGLGETRVHRSSIETRQGFLKMLLNGREVNSSTQVKNGDKISFVPIVSGG